MSACSFEVPDATYPPASTAQSLVRPSVTGSPSVESGTEEKKTEGGSGTETSPGSMPGDTTDTTVGENVLPVNAG